MRSKNLKPSRKLVVSSSSEESSSFARTIDDSKLSVAWKSAAKVLKVAAADRAEYEAEKASLADQLKERTALWKYSEIIFPGDDASPVAEQSLAPPVADNMTKEEVVRLRGKVSEMEKALSRARDSINRTQQSRLNAVTIELSCKDTEILTANNEAELWKESLKKKKLETMAENQQVLALLSTIEKQKNDHLHHQSVVTNNTDLLKKQDV
ncbi:hypothetical protein GIB67_019969 [Kingdonia uniflora]|uniref:Uncharacterized protein n=1 Tax=Kingdonia uniflora TaxID=39325 RepID=A0A7J7MKN2_9MAGN|nr:hypothetical protein GIB67_019969 [Kingdonia uniflora]